MREKVRSFAIGDGRGETKTEVHNGVELDTRIKIGNVTICWVAGVDRIRFLKELNEIVKKYRI